MPETTKTIRHNTIFPTPPSATPALRPLAAALFALLSLPALCRAESPAAPAGSLAEPPSPPPTQASAPSPTVSQPTPEAVAENDAEAQSFRSNFDRAAFDRAFLEEREKARREAAFAKRAAALDPIDRADIANEGESLFREADDVLPLRLTVPPLRPSRIDFPDERILSVVVDSSRVEVRGESDRSDFFLLPKHPGSTTLFVTLARGETVPVEVTVREDAKPRNVVLHLKDRTAKPAANLRADLPAMKSVPYADLFTGLLTDLENGRRSRGVMLVASGPEAPRTRAVETVVARLSPLSVATDAVWRTRELTVTRLVVRNGKLREAVVDEAALLTEGVLAFAAGKPSLKPADAMHFYVFEAK